MYNAKQLDAFTTIIKKDFGFNNVEFDKEIDGDFYFYCYDLQGKRDRIRIKSQMGTVFTFFQGQWKQVKGYKIECSDLF